MMSFETMSVVRRHHYVPRFFLKNFCIPGTEQVDVLDRRKAKPFRSNISNVALERDFNRIDVAGAPIDTLERAYGVAEYPLDQSLQEVLRRGSLGRDKAGHDVLELAALMHTRNPRQRATVSNFMGDVSRQLARLMVHTPERWKAALEDMRRAGRTVREDVTYEQVRDFVQRDAYSVNVTNNAHARFELDALDAVSLAMFATHWRTLRARPGAGPFVTSDHPVCPTEFPPGAPTVFFALSPSLAIEPRPEDEPDQRVVDDIDIAFRNRLTVSCAYRAVYAPALDFPVMGDDGFIRSGHELFDAPWFRTESA